MWVPTFDGVVGGIRDESFQQTHSRVSPLSSDRSYEAKFVNRDSYSLHLPLIRCSASEARVITKKGSKSDSALARLVRHMHKGSAPCTLLCSQPNQPSIVDPLPLTPPLLLSFNSDDHRPVHVNDLGSLQIRAWWRSSASQSLTEASRGSQYHRNVACVVNLSCVCVFQMRTSTFLRLCFLFMQPADLFCVNTVESELRCLLLIHPSGGYGNTRGTSRLAFLQYPSMSCSLQEASVRVSF